MTSWRRWLDRSTPAQALAEAALASMVLALLAMLGVDLLVLHRVHTAALSAAYACAQYISQFPHRPQRAAALGQEIAHRTLAPRAWSALRSASFSVTVEPPEEAGSLGRCTVTYWVTLPFAPPGMDRRQGTAIYSYSRGERWQGRW